ncbi:type VII secretion protein EccB (plasmid) [Streptomyces sp. AHU1]|uniref:type VII secretion protein EccB n=1 Tax=Streptomyces sp. AHU1 TaxID=3377215 RepID=UPI0038779B75
MQSKRDQVQAHMFVMERLSSGMLVANPDAPESPLSRTGRGAVVGIVLAVLVAAGAYVFGFFSPGQDNSWRAPGTLVINSDTGARYLYSNGRLHPVLNYASALLLAGKDLKTTTAHSGTLSGAPIGLPVGIPDAPDSVPAASSLDTSSWKVCVATSAAGRTSTTLVAGAPIGEVPAKADEALLVSGPDKSKYLVWRGSRLELDKSTHAAESLGFAAVEPRHVSAAFLGALSQGPALKAPTVAGRGQRGPRVGGIDTRVGQILSVIVPGSSATQAYLVTRQGLLPLTPTGAALILGDPATRTLAYQNANPVAAQVGSAAVSQYLAPSGSRLLPTTLPETPPYPMSVPDDTAACAVQHPSRAGVQISLGLVRAETLGPRAQQPTSTVKPGCLPVDAVVVRPGHAVLVNALAGDGSAIGDTTYLVTETGVKYRIPSTDSLTALGFGDTDAERLPAPLLSMLPSGPDLGTDAAAGSAQVRITAPDCGGPLQRQ